MKAIHYAGIPCKTEEVGGLTYTHVNNLVTCKECKSTLNGETKESKVEQPEIVKDDKRGNKRSRIKRSV